MARYGVGIVGFEGKRASHARGCPGCGPKPNPEPLLMSMAKVSFASALWTGRWIYPYPNDGSYANPILFKKHELFYVVQLSAFIDFRFISLLTRWTLYSPVPLKKGRSPSPPLSSADRFVLYIAARI